MRKRPIASPTLRRMVFSRSKSEKPTFIHNTGRDIFMRL
jgi:hypothetical protein